MGIHVDIPGLSQFISEIPDGSVVIIEGSVDLIKTIFAQKLGCGASKNGRTVAYITSRSMDEIAQQVSYYNQGVVPFTIVEDRTPERWRSYIQNGTALIIDSFSYMMLDKSAAEFRSIFEDLRRVCKEQHAVVLLLTDRGMLEGRVEIIGSYLADGIIQFLTTETSDGIARFIRIPKWMNGHSFDMSIYYTLDDKRINVDLRYRIV